MVPSTFYRIGYSPYTLRIGFAHRPVVHVELAEKGKKDQPLRIIQKFRIFSKNRY